MPNRLSFERHQHGMNSRRLIRSPRRRGRAARAEAWRPLFYNLNRLQFSYRLIVIREIEVLIRCGRVTAPLPFDFGA